MSLDDRRPGPGASGENPAGDPERGDHLQYLLTAYLFDSISEEGRREVEGHLEHCSDCRAELQVLRQTLGLLQGALGDGHEGYSFDERRRSRVLAAAARKRGRIVGFIVAHPALCSAAALVIALMPVLVSIMFQAGTVSDRELRFTAGGRLGYSLSESGEASPSERGEYAETPSRDAEKIEAGELALPETRNWAARGKLDGDGSASTTTRYRSVAMGPSTPSSTPSSGQPAPTAEPAVEFDAPAAAPVPGGADDGRGGATRRLGGRAGGEGQVEQRKAEQQGRQMAEQVWQALPGRPANAKNPVRLPAGSVEEPAAGVSEGRGRQDREAAEVNDDLLAKSPPPARKPGAPPVRAAPLAEGPPAPPAEPELPATRAPGASTATGSDFALADGEETVQGVSRSRRSNEGPADGGASVLAPAGERSRAALAESPDATRPAGSVSGGGAGAQGGLLGRAAVEFGKDRRRTDLGLRVPGQDRDSSLLADGLHDVGDLNGDSLPEAKVLAPDSGGEPPAAGSTVRPLPPTSDPLASVGERLVLEGEVATRKEGGVERREVEEAGAATGEDFGVAGLDPSSKQKASEPSRIRDVKANSIPDEWGQVAAPLPGDEMRSVVKGPGGTAPDDSATEFFDGRRAARDQKTDLHSATRPEKGIESVQAGGGPGPGQLLAGKRLADQARRQGQQQELVEKLFAAYDNYRGRDPNLRFDDFVASPRAVPPPQIGDEGLGREGFRARYGTNPFVETSRDRESTFALEVDTASFSRSRSVLASGRLPPPESVRVEEFVNYIRQDYPTDPHEVFAVHCDGSPSPFAPSQVELLRIGIKARELVEGERQNAVLTFAIDVSGSMAMARGAAGSSQVVAPGDRTIDSRLDLVKRSIRVLLGELAPTDQVALVSFASQATLVLPHTPARHAERIEGALDSLFPQGGTNVEAGLDLAYRLASDALSPGSVHRVILISDGVANIGARDPDEVLARVKVFARRGIYLSIYGVGGEERFNDDFLERLTNEGNGKYDYIDSLDEARRLFVEQLPANLSVLARDAKIQVVFQPEAVSRYRLLGYENRDIRDEDFRNDRVDAGEVGPGSTVTALYEVVRRRTWSGPLGKVYLRYFNTRTQQVEERNYPMPAGVIATDIASSAGSLRLVCCAAELAELLRHSYYARDGSFSDVLAALATMDAGTRARPEWKDLYAMASRARQLTVASWNRALGVEVQVNTENGR